MDSLNAYIEKLFELGYEGESPSNFYSKITRLSLTNGDEKEFKETVAPKINQFCEKEFLRKDLMYLSLLACGNVDVLRTILEYYHSIRPLDIEDPASIYDYCIYNNTHWLHEIIDNTDSYNKLQSLSPIISKLKMLRLIKLTNSIQLDVDQVNNLLSQINTDFLDDFWELYIKEIRRLLDVAQFCQNVEKKCNIKEVFEYASQSSLLLTLSVYLKFDDPSKWDLLHEKMTLWETDTKNSTVFTGFVVLATVINLINKSESTNDINETVDNVKTKLLSLSDQPLQIEVLENIFGLLFYRKRDEFVCECLEVRLILVLLKSVIEELELKKVYKGSFEYRRLQALHDYVTDGLWRLDLISNSKTKLKQENRMMNYMLAAPKSLIRLCLKKSDFERAHQVLKMFEMTAGEFVLSFMYNLRVFEFLEFLRKRRKSEDALTTVIIENEYQKLDNSAKQFVVMFDFAISAARSQADTNFLLGLAEEGLNFCPDERLPFYKAIVELFREVLLEKDIPIADILNCPDYPLDLVKWKTNEEFYKTLALHYDEFMKGIKTRDVGGSFNRNHPTHKTVLKINEICHKHVDKNTQLLLRVYNYLKSFSRVLFIEQNNAEIVSQGTDASYFELLRFNRSELIGKLLFERHMDPVEFERYFGKLKLDFLYHVVGNCFPTVNLHVQKDVTIEELYHDNMLFIPSKGIIHYIQKRNWLLAFMLNEMYKVEDVQIEISRFRLQTFFNYLKIRRIQNLKEVFDGNEIVTALQNCISSQRVRYFIQERIVKTDLMSVESQLSSHDEIPPDIPPSPSSSDSSESGEEDPTNWKGLFEVVNSIPLSQLRKKPELEITRNNVLINLIQDSLESEYYKFVNLIDDREARIDTILRNFKRWPGDFAIDIIRAEVTKFDAVEDLKLQHLTGWLPKIELCQKVMEFFEDTLWFKTYETCKRNPQLGLRIILQIPNIDILLDFINIFKPSEEILVLVKLNEIMTLIELDSAFPKVKTLLDSLPSKHAMAICDNLLTVLQKLNYLEFIADYLGDKNVTQEEDHSLDKVRVSLKILSAFNSAEQEQFFCLVREPLNILEVLVMNTKLDKLSAVLEILNLSGSSDDCDKDVINVDKVDSLLRKYAEKSLDFRVVTQPNPRLVRTPEHKLLQSVDTLNLNNVHKTFVMPTKVPRKVNWVQNEEVLECMACHMVNFSMFTRRHHCRRCGRVVCYNCSSKRMLVDTYGDILVRVCSDCYEQTMGRSEAPSMRSFHEYWLLNDDSEHNEIMREEFSYEYAPSVSLCLSILKFHSKTNACPQFMLNQCESMLMLLQPSQEPTQEIDYLLVIKMLRNLAMAAKMLSAEYNLSAGIATADKILSQSEMLALLVEKGCLSLMPVLNNRQGPYIATNDLRRLRDKLLEMEQWEMALEVSTKAGLDNAGIFAAWGKSCLRAGSLELAREKFQRCMDSTSRYESSSTYLSTESLNRWRVSTRGSSGSNLASDFVQPTIDPALVREIVRILEEQTYKVDPSFVRGESETARMPDVSGSVSSLNMIKYISVKPDPTINILHRIKNLKDIALEHESGGVNITSLRENSLQSPGKRPKLDEIFYNECVFYLKRYGTHSSLLKFYVRHDEIHKALIYVRDKNLSSDLFVELYANCLKSGSVIALQENMALIDKYFDVWKDHLQHVCRYLERHRLLHTLYQLQLFVEDYVRAAMTCIMFYEENVTNFTELSKNVHHLLKAEEHLKQVVEDEQYFDPSLVARKVDLDSNSGLMVSKAGLVLRIEYKHISTHLMTIKRQKEVMEFLTNCESRDVDTVGVLKDLLQLNDPTKVLSKFKEVIPTLFGSHLDKTCLVVLVLICGSAVEDGFGLASSLIEDFKLKHIQVYRMAGAQMAKRENYKGISELAGCIRTSGFNDAEMCEMVDEMLTSAVGTFMKNNVTNSKIEDMIKYINNKATKISTYIDAKHFKMAYFLAVKYKRTSDIERIQREAESVNELDIARLCGKWLQLYSPESLASLPSQDDVSDVS